MKNKLSLWDRLVPPLFAPPLRPAMASAGNASLPSKTGRRGGLMLFAADESESDDREVVDVTRRRADDAPGPEGRERAAAPTRRREEAPPSIPPPPPPRDRGSHSSAGGSAGGGNIKLSLPVLLIGALLICCVGAIMVWALSSGPAGSEQPPEEPATVATVAIATRPAAALASPTSAAIRPTATRRSRHSGGRRSRGQPPLLPVRRALLAPRRLHPASKSGWSCSTRTRPTKPWMRTSIST